jgi:hypothetical protein
MKTIAAAIAGLMLATSVAAAAPAGYESGSANSKCLWAYMVDHTTYVKPNTLLFHMRDGRVYKNVLSTRCDGLAFHGFIYETRSDEICSNSQSIRVLESHEVCQLGRFVPLEKNHQAPSSY